SSYKSESPAHHPPFCRIQGAPLCLSGLTRVMHAHGALRLAALSEPDHHPLAATLTDPIGHEALSSTRGRPPPSTSPTTPERSSTASSCRLVSSTRQRRATSMPRRCGFFRHRITCGSSCRRPSSSSNCQPSPSTRSAPSTTPYSGFPASCSTTTAPSDRCGSHASKSRATASALCSASCHNSPTGPPTHLRPIVCAYPLFTVNRSGVAPIASICCLNTA